MIDLLKALADETRLRIFGMILNGDMCVCEIEKCLNLSQSNASRHLTVLKKAGILDSYKEAQWSYYKIAESFKNEDELLFKYIKERVTLLPGYKKEQEKFRKCKLLDLCNCKVGGDIDE